MNKYITMLLTVLAFTTTVAPQNPALSNKLYSYTDDKYTITSFGSFAGYNDYTDYIEIYPHYKAPNHVTLQEVEFSSDAFLNVILREVDANDWYHAKSDKYDIFVYNGVSMGFFYLDDKSAIFARTDDLSDGYIKEVFKHINVKVD